MRILALTNLYPNPFQPHRAPFNRHQFRILASSHPVRVIAPIAWTDELKARRKGAPALAKTRMANRDDLTVEHPRYWFTPRLLRAQYGRFFRMSVRGAFDRALAEFHPDLVFAPWAYPDGWAAVRLAHRAGLPVVIQVHGSDVLLLDKFPARQKKTLEALRQADGIVAVSHDIANRLLHHGVCADRVRVIHDGVDTTLFHPGPQKEARDRLGISEGDPLVLFVGNLLPVKAIDVLLEACRRAQNGTRFRLFIIGDGPLRVTLERLAARLGIADRVRFLGILPQQQLPDWYRAADLFVLPSHSEGVPNVLLEASACGTRYVASKVGGIPEIAHLGAAQLTPPGDPAALAEAIRESLSQSKRRPEAAPRRREEAVAELADFLSEVRARPGPSRERLACANCAARTSETLVLRACCSRLNLVRLLAQRRFAILQMNILFLHKQILFPHDTGGKIRALNIMRHLPKWHRVTYVCNIRPGEERYVCDMKALGLHLEAVPGETSRRGGLRFAAGLFANLLSSRPFSVNRNYDPMVRKRVGELLSSQHFDVLICDCVQMARHVFGQRAAVNILFQHNVEAQILERHAASSSWKRRWYMKRDWKKMKRFESECGRQFEAVIAVSDADRKKFESDYGWTHVDVIDTAVDTDFFSKNSGEPAPDRVVFVGSMDWLPNQDGVRWFINEVWPQVKTKRPSARFQVVGRNPPPAIKARGQVAGVEIVGSVPDVRPFLKEASVCIVPLLVGGGTRLKIFEAMATGRAIVSTAVGAEGLPVRPGEHYLLANGAADFAGAVVRVLQEPDLRSRLESTACQFVRDRFGTEPIARQFEAICLRVWREHAGKC